MAARLENPLGVLSLLKTTSGCKTTAAAINKSWSKANSARISGLGDQELMRMVKVGFVSCW
jgi:hypothetical protein